MLDVRVLVLTLVLAAAVASGCATHDATVRVQRLVGLSEEQAYSRLADAQLCPAEVWGIYSRGDDYIVSQDPPAGTRVRPLALIKLGVPPSGPSGVIVELAVNPNC